MDSLVMTYVILLVMLALPMLYYGFMMGREIALVVRRFFHCRSLRQQIESHPEYGDFCAQYDWEKVNRMRDNLIIELDSLEKKVEDHPGYVWHADNFDRAVSALELLTLLREYIWEYGSIKEAQ